MAFHALLIGNWDYHDPSKVLGALRGPENDIELPHRALTDPQFGLFDDEDIVVRQNLVGSDIRLASLELIQGAKKGDRLLVYYSGHGEVLSGGRLGLCGIDIDHGRKEAFCFDTSELLAWMDDFSPAASMVVILDCCYAGQLAMKGGPAVPDAALERFGRGVAALCSSGNEQSADAKAAAEPSPFTRALVQILTDPAVIGDEAGFLSVDRVAEALANFAGLRPSPKFKVSAQGSLQLARRPVPAAADEPLKGWRDDVPVTIELTFDAASVRAELGGSASPLVRELATFDEHRRNAVRLLEQLADVVARAETLGGSTAPDLVRASWECIGANLFDSVVPTGLYERVRSLQADSRVVKLRLRFEPGCGLEGFPWEHLFPPVQAEAADARADGRRPLGLRTGLLLERVPSARIAPLAPSQSKSLAVFNSLPGEMGEAGGALADQIGRLARYAVVGDNRGPKATWEAFLDILINSPRHLVLCVPVRRIGPDRVEIGFSQVGPGCEWRSVNDVLREIADNGVKLDVLVLVTFAAEPARDASRGTVEVARAVAEAGIGPVVFVCHGGGFSPHLTGAGSNSFTYLLLDALGHGKSLDSSFYWARDRSMRLGNDEMRATFGVPGYYGYYDDAGAVRRSGGDLPPTSAFATRGPTS